MQIEYHVTEKPRMEKIELQDKDRIIEFDEFPSEFASLINEEHEMRTNIAYIWVVENGEMVEEYNYREHKREITQDERETILNLSNEEFLQWWAEKEQESQLPFKIYSLYSDGWYSRFQHLAHFGHNKHIKQDMFSFKLRINDDMEIAAKELELILNYIKPTPIEGAKDFAHFTISYHTLDVWKHILEQVEEVKLLNLIEHTCGESGSYDIGVFSIGEQIYYCINAWYGGVSCVTEDIQELLQYIRENHYAS